MAEMFWTRQLCATCILLAVNLQAQGQVLLSKKLSSANFQTPMYISEPISRSIPALEKLEGKLDRPYSALIDEIAVRHGLDPQLVHAVVKIESAYQQDAVSRKGAIGLMQLLPETASRFGKKILKDPRENLEAGCSYLSWLMKHFKGQLPLALAGYNAGENAVTRYGNTIPPFAETRDYVSKVLATYTIFQSGDIWFREQATPLTSIPHGKGELGQLFKLLTNG